MNWSHCAKTRQIQDFYLTILNLYELSCWMYKSASAKWLRADLTFNSNLKLPTKGSDLSSETSLKRPETQSVSLSSYTAAYGPRFPDPAACKHLIKLCSHKRKEQNDLPHQQTSEIAGWSCCRSCEAPGNHCKLIPAWAPGAFCELWRRKAFKKQECMRRPPASCIPERSDQWAHGCGSNSG